MAYLFGDNWLSQTLYKVLALVMLFVGGLAAYQFVWDLGAAGVGLIVGCGLPQLLGLADFQPWPLLIGYVLVALGCLEEVRGHEGHSD